MRGTGGKHWSDNNTLGQRAFFAFSKTGMRSETNAPIIASKLKINPLRPEDGGTYRCRVDFKEAPTKNTKINLELISECSPVQTSCFCYTLLPLESGQRIRYVTGFLNW